MDDDFNILGGGAANPSEIGGMGSNAALDLRASDPPIAHVEGAVCAPILEAHQDQHPTEAIDANHTVSAAQAAPPPAPAPAPGFSEPAEAEPEQGSFLGLAPEPPSAEQQQALTDSVPVHHQPPLATVDDEAETDSDVDVPPPPEVAMVAAAAAAAPAPPAPRPPLAPKPGKGAGGSRRGGGRSIISLEMLIQEGIIEPGEDVLSVDYKGMTHLATLLADGRIHTVVNGKELTFESPSAFSIYLKRLVNPSRKADDGWKTVKYRGRLLEQYKHELARQRLGGLEGEGGSSASLAEALEPRTKRPRMDASSAFMALPHSTGSGAAAVQVPIVPDRPRRQRRAPPRFAAIGVDDEHALQPLEAYGPGEAPLTLRVSPAAEAMMDFHAHLCMNEVIGILGGVWDPVAKRIDVMRAFPVRELATEDDAVNVEMDPEDQVAKMEEVSKAGLRVVGWYHSHPTFPAIPSTIDIYNQVLQQHAHREEGGEGSAAPHAEPYVAAIVSPYDAKLPTHKSALTWFYVAHAPGAVPIEGQRPDEVGCVGKELPAEQLWEPLGALDNLPGLQKDMQQLAKQYAPLPERANLDSGWYDGSLRIDKLVKSVQSRLPVALLGDAKVKGFTDKLFVSTRAVWNIYGKPASALMGHAGQQASAAAGSAPESAAVSQGGVTEGGMSGPAHDEDEPISDDEDTV